MIHILYRTAESKNKNKKGKPNWINNINCLMNMYSLSDDAQLIVFGDRLEKETKEFVLKHCDRFIETTQHGNSESFLQVYQYALDNFENDDIVYFVEDDYLHRPGFTQILIEGLERADYVSLYDHPDKYTGQPESLFLTKSSHWKFTHSTTMTFAAKVRTLNEDAHIWQSMVTTGTPPDHYIFLKLRGLHRRLATPIPGYSTHGETEWLSPVINWKNIAEDLYDE